MPEMPRYTWGAKGFGRNPLRAAGTEEFEPMRVLIVEDEALVALELEELLLGEGFEVVGSAADATQAIDLGRRHQPDVALLRFKSRGRANGATNRKDPGARTACNSCFCDGAGELTTVRPAWSVRRHREALRRPGYG